MASAGLVMMAAAAALQGAPAPVCGTALGEDIQLFDAVSVEKAAPVALRLQRKARLQQSFALSAGSMQLPPGPLATHKGRPVDVRFQRTLSPDGTGERWCTSHTPDGLVGARDPDGTYLLRCLVDADGDGRHEALQAQGRLVPMNQRRSAAPVPPPAPRPLPGPVTLVPAAAVRSTIPFGFAPRIIGELRVTEVGAAAAVIERKLQPAIFASDSFRSWADAERWTVPLQAGEWTAPDGTHLWLAGSGKDWTVSAPGGWFRTPALGCRGAFVELPATFAVFGFGGFGTYRRAAAN